MARRSAKKPLSHKKCASGTRTIRTAHINLTAWPGKRPAKRWNPKLAAARRRYLDPTNRYPQADRDLVKDDP